MSENVPQWQIDNMNAAHNKKQREKIVELQTGLADLQIDSACNLRGWESTSTENNKLKAENERLIKERLVYKNAKDDYKAELATLKQEGDAMWDGLNSQIVELHDEIVAIDAALEPVKTWYGGGTEGNHTGIEILTDAISDLQKDRKEVLRLQAQIAQLKEQLRWILVSEGPPKKDEEVLTYVDGKSRVDCYCKKHGGYWVTLGNSPTHWKLITLPEQEKNT